MVQWVFSMTLNLGILNIRLSLHSSEPVRQQFIQCFGKLFLHSGNHFASHSFGQ